jgi:peptidoglycan/xylan/chitin deacetylase (PgdA/CDA1 family)
MDATRVIGRLLPTIGIAISVGIVIDPPGAVAGSTAQASSLRVPVLMYHRISAAPSHAALPHLWVSPRRFRAQLRALKRAGWTTITAKELGRAVMEGRRVGRKRFVITIDDGARDGWWNAAPILEDLGMRATYCVVPGRAHRPWQLSFRHMRRLRAAGHEIANHSLTHADLRQLSGPSLRRQVFRARWLIRERVGHAPRTFCYPMGFHDAEVRRVVAQAGHLLAFTTVEGARHTATDPMRSPRVRVNGSDTPREVLASVRP